MSDHYEVFVFSEDIQHLEENVIYLMRRYILIKNSIDCD